MPLDPNAAFQSTTWTPDQLIAGDADDVLSEKVTLKTGEDATKTIRGAVVGRTATGGVIAGAANAGNTGNGVLGGLAINGAAKEGKYSLVCIAAAANAGTFEVVDPDGITIGKATVAGAAFAGAIGFTIADGAVDFVVGDSFTVTVSALTYKYRLAATANVDGSDAPVGIIAQDADATAADVDLLVYTAGTFNDTQLTFGAGHSVATVKETLLKRGIHLVHAQAA